MTYRGKIQNGAVVFDDPAALPEGAKVDVEVVVERTDDSTNDLLRMLDFMGDAGIADLSTNIDHYLHGHPKVEDAE